MKEYKEKTSNDMLQEQLKEIFGDKTPEEAREMLLTFRRLMSCYQCAMMEIETKVRVLNEEFSLLHDRNPINNIHTRLKKRRQHPRKDDSEKSSSKHRSN